jgi:hypothetical protein
VCKLVFSWKPHNQEKMAGIHFTTQENNAFAIFNQFIVSLCAQCHGIASQLLYTYWVQASASRSCPTPPAVQLNSIFSAKTDPRENPEKTLKSMAMHGLCDILRGKAGVH